MKKIIAASTVAIFMLTALPTFSQTYKTFADTVALNAEYSKVTKDITDLTAKLDKAKSDQANDEKKAGEASTDAQTTASNTTTKAENSINGSVKQARKAKREARRSVKDAKDARHAQSNLNDSNKKVIELNSQLEKKQQRLKELDEMRASINATQQ